MSKTRWEKRDSSVLVDSGKGKTNKSFVLRGRQESKMESIFFFLTERRKEKNGKKSRREGNKKREWESYPGEFWNIWKSGSLTREKHSLRRQ